MPLSIAAEREPLHTRTIEITGYIRKDGLWDIEGHLTDIKHYDHETRWRGDMPAGRPVHEMWARLTVDDHLEIQDCEVAFDNHPFPTCLESADTYKTLKGLRIGPGWMRGVRQRAGGIHGCTHVGELLSQIGTTAYQTFVAKKRVKGVDAIPEGSRPFMLDTCHAMRADGEVVREVWPEWYEGEQETG